MGGFRLFGEGGTLGVGWGKGSPLDMKLKGLGAQAEDLDVLVQAIKRRVSVAAHDNVIREADAAGQVKVLLSGTTCSYNRKENGSRSILAFHHAGDFCNLHRYVLPNCQTAIAVQALTDCTVGIIEYRDVDRLLSHSALASALWRASVLEAAYCRERLSRTSRGTALERVAHLLCEQMARREAIGIRGPLPFSQIDVADAVALSIVHVNRTIQTLRGLNVLSKTGHAIEVVDREKLEKIAGFHDRYLDLPNFVSKWTVQIEPARRAALGRDSPNHPTVSRIARTARRIH
jgi:CRP-like cAMP-binding protein